MLFIVIETFAVGRVSEVYQFVRERGCSLPNGLTYSSVLPKSDQ
jgi:hypothetical protein